VTPPPPHDTSHFLCYIKKNISEFQKGGGGGLDPPLDLLVKSYPSTTSPGEIVPGYDFPRRSRSKYFWYDFSEVRSPVRIRVRMDPPHPLVCRKRRLNGAVFRMRPEKPRPWVTTGVAR
jgi:hypothetical protein